MLKAKTLLRSGIPSVGGKSLRHSAAVPNRAKDETSEQHRKQEVIFLLADLKAI